MTLSTFELAPITYREAAQFFRRYEHLGNCGLGVWHWGGYLHDRMVAAVSFGTTCFACNRGELSRVAQFYGLGMYQIARGGTATDAPFNTPSRIVSAALAALQRERGDCLVVAYADRKFNEIGTIYQACNGLYTGKTNPKNQSDYFINGRLMSGWLVRKKYGTRSLAALQQIDPNAVKIPLRQKYRYVFVQATGRKKRKIVEAMRPLVLPYPRRPTEAIPPMNITELVQKRGRSNRSGHHCQNK